MLRIVTARSKRAPGIGEADVLTELPGVPRPAAIGRTAPAIVIYHHVSDQPDPLVDQLGIATPPDVFLRHVRHFAKNFDLVSLSEVIEGRLPRRPLLITFDDAYRSVLDVAGPILRSAHAPSAFFINPGTLSPDALALDNLLSLAAGRLGASELLSRLEGAPRRPATFSDVLFGHVAGLGRRRTEQVKLDLQSMLNATAAEIRRTSALFMDGSDVAKLADYGIDVGNHSMTHCFFRSLSEDELDAEIAGSREVLQHLSGRPVDSLSVPYGYEADATPAALRVARRSGHRAVFLVHGRSNRYRQPHDLFYRTNPRTTPPLLLGLKLQVAPLARTLFRRFTRGDGR